MVAISRLDVRRLDSVKRFKREIRRTMEAFLRFTHRYWFHEVSTQDQARELFGMWSRHLGTEQLFAEVREEVDHAGEPPAVKLFYFLLAAVLSVGLILYTMHKSKAMADFLETLSNDRVGWKAKAGALGRVRKP